MKTRDRSIDVLRGLAIFSMIAANMAANNFAEPHPFFFRLFGSFAAPTFVFLSGFMVSYAGAQKGYGFLYYLKRGLMTLLVAALMDVFFWKLLPFVSFDVLYVIGLSLPVVWLLGKLGKWSLAIAGVLLIGLAPLIQQYIPYQPLPTEIYVSEKGLLQLFCKAPVFANFLSYGWFPVIPWMGVSMLGAFIGKLRIDQGAAALEKPLLISGFFMLLAGIVTWVLTAPHLYVREGYSELFYPPTPAFFSVYLGLIFVLLVLLFRLRELKFLHVFSVYGRSSLLMYVTHTATIIFFFNEYFKACAGIVFVQLWLMNAFFLWWLAAFVQALKEQVNRLPFALRFIIGG